MSEAVLEVEWLGRIEYGLAWEHQKALAAERAASPHLPDKLLLLEHPHTYTLGRSGRFQHLLLDEASLAGRGISLYQVDRGGDITYHGPGQLVGYPILNLKRLHARRGLRTPDLHLYLRELEEVIIQVLAEFGLAGWRYQKYTGVWVSTAAGPRKIAAIGIRVTSRGITYHGFALNVAPDLSYFAGIIPCGIQEHGVTSMLELTGRPLAVAGLLPSLTAAFSRVLGLEAAVVAGPLKEIGNVVH
ncbi:MAG: lipoyl(octanoyl) transferase LipB [Chloroflexi bacterium]|nr:lipoyl(octanoyl) transferase LipB [Chloroflexota bacterium]MCI0577124.1 lipoyl(octanoyl) transferase LipB [Chloroflexota bacterium]MCI0646833.1 lipoyl(octanoyl) transferase LipB [Chloroflexota bacterium]MCI0728818.1 lipoyl(octanoyl) transferase LipB [Chloroflexota bacterium]